MRVCLIADRADHPVLEAMLAELAARHRTHLIVTGTGGAFDRSAAAELADPADLYLLKSRSREGLELAGRVEGKRARVVNTPAATARCLDRVAMAEGLETAGIPGPRTIAVGTLADVAGAVGAPAMVKSRASRRGDLVRSVATRDDVNALLEGWAREPVIVQELCPSDGWDYKAWVIGDGVHVSRRLSPLQTGAVGEAKRNHPISDPAVERILADLARSVGDAFALELFGIDIVMHSGAASVIDVNAFPGFRGVPDAPVKLAAYAENAAGRTGAVA